MSTMLDVNYVMIQLQFYSEQIASTICAQSTLLILRACSYGEKLGEKEGLGVLPQKIVTLLNSLGLHFWRFLKQIRN